MPNFGVNLGPPNGTQPGVVGLLDQAATVNLGNQGVVGLRVGTNGNYSTEGIQSQRDAQGT